MTREDSVSYLLDVRSETGRWNNVAICKTEEDAKEEAAEWDKWLQEKLNSLREIRIVKKSITMEILPFNPTQPNPTQHQ